MTDITILKGKTFRRVLRWESGPLIYKPITAITKASPAVITAASHGVVDGWRVAVISVLGMRQINAENWPLHKTDFYKATVVDPNTVKLNDVVSADYTAYISGGSLVYNTPVSLAACTARMQIRTSARATGTPLVDLVSPTDIVLDDTAKTITITIDADDTAAYTFRHGVYDLEIVSGSVVTQLLSGGVTVVDEVTK